MKKEVEVFGVTYDRYVLLQLHKIMTAELGLKRVLEMPSHGAKAAGSLYSIGFGLAGCQVELANPELEAGQSGVGNDVRLGRTGNTETGGNVHGC
jgi:hypothetical protein